MLCAICKKQEFRPWRFHELEQCSFCGFIRNSEVMSSTALNAIQLAHFGSEFATRGVYPLERLHERLTNRRRVAQLKRFLTPPARILEVGIGHGQLLKRLLSLGHCAEGLDSSPDVCAAVKETTCQPIHCGSLEDFARNSQRGIWDAVIMCHVLEHFEDPTAALNAVKSLLRAGGLLYIAVPNVSALEAHLPGWTGYAPYHVSYFEQATLTLLFHNIGFVAEEIATWEPFSGWFNAIVKTFLINAPIEPSSRAQRSSVTGILRTVHDIIRLGFGGVLWPVRWLQALAGYGEELTIIGRRFGG